MLSILILPPKDDAVSLSTRRDVDDTDVLFARVCDKYFLVGQFLSNFCAIMAGQCLKTVFKLYFTLNDQQKYLKICRKATKNFRH